MFCNKPSENTKFKMLALDGGGIRGLIEARIAAEIERRSQRYLS